MVIIHLCPIQQCLILVTMLKVNQMLSQIQEKWTIELEEETQSLWACKIVKEMDQVGIQLEQL